MKKAKHILTIVICVAVLICLGGLLVLRKSYQDHPVNETDAKTAITITWQGEEYTGIYEGELSNSVPGGEGTFTSDDGMFIYTGSWKKGMFNGDGTIVRADDASEENGTYKSGKRNGYFTTVYSDGSYTTALYANDVICGNYNLYNSEGELSERISYIEGEPVEDYTAQAKELTAEMIRSGEAGSGVVYVEGKVTFLYQNASTIYYDIETETIGIVAGKVANAGGAGVSQAYIPNLREGDEVRIYGTYGGYKKNTTQKDTEYYGYNLPTIDAAYVVLQSNTYSLLSPYRQLVRAPFDVYADPVNKSFVVKRVKRTGEKFLIFAVAEDDTNENHQYLLWCKTSIDETFLMGSVIHVDGYYDGQYKELYEEDGEGKIEVVVSDTDSGDEGEDEDDETSADIEDIDMSDADGLVVYPRIRVLNYSLD